MKLNYCPKSSHSIQNKFQKVDKSMREVRRAEETLRYRKEEPPE